MSSLSSGDSDRPRVMAGKGCALRAPWAAQQRSHQTPERLKPSPLPSMVPYSGNSFVTLGGVKCFLHDHLQREQKRHVTHSERAHSHVNQFPHVSGTQSSSGDPFTGSSPTLCNTSCSTPCQGVPPLGLHENPQRFWA